MSNSIFLPNGMEAIQAEYKEFPLEEFNQNPLIQALPPLLDKAAIIRKLMVKPIYNDEEKHAESIYRIHMINRLFQLYTPLPVHIDVWNMIHTLILQGYLARNPFDKNYKKYINDSGKEIINRSYEINSRQNFRTTSSCGTFIGFSGMGKTTTINRVLSDIPQVIIHNEYKGIHFNQIQLVWLKLEAPSNSSLKALCLQFFMKVDELLGTNNYKKYVSRNMSVDSMLPLISQVAHNIGLGLLVIDETQNIKKRGAEPVMNFFVYLINTGINLCLIGTPGAYDLFGKELRMTRRLTGNAEIIYNNMEYGNEFTFLLESIWQYQWTRNLVSYNEEFGKVIYEETQGISDLVVKLFVYSQQQAIESGKEELSIDLIKKVAKEKFRLLQPMLNAIRSGNPHKIAKYEDIRKIELDETGIRKSKELKKEVPVRKKGEDKAKATKLVGEPKRKKKRGKYKEDDLRYLLQQGKEEKSPYQILLENDYIEDTSKWIEVIQ
ncbi:Transposon Tn7 transposition protein TnsC [Oceanobacillus picturae]|uniref:Transposon Tn7 transposition protein TnsC n=1 Tax=Oceanobacillus picturae TaxID=171693 RepID=W9ANU8_9BACI|nr:AAA family ATPase [Oceanobacillus picturae]CDO04316.1 Transposon Tn7 transposition protein TnsC [Oceanobacillus picturae]